MTSSTESPLLVSVKKTAYELLDLDVSTVYKMLDRGELEGRYIGRRRMVVYESVKAYVEGLPTYPQEKP